MNEEEVETRPPEADDMTVCGYCAAILKFEAGERGLRLCTVTAEEFIDLPASMRASLKDAQDFALSHGARPK